MVSINMKKYVDLSGGGTGYEKENKRIFDDIIIGLKGKDALACLESLEKSRRISCRTGIPLKGSRTKIDSYPLRYRIIYKGFCNQWSLAELNAALQEKMRKFSMPGI